ncbi:MAG: magnesium/cobalt transporter CorA [Deltaproteobacteria bacterium]|nr:magnesium/cobalt transporter CorA [Deltaproteobacteria bacterium]
MDRIFQQFSRKAGLPPGSVVHVGEEREQRSRIYFVRYSESECREQEYLNIQDLPDDASEGTVTWVHVNGIHQARMIEELGRKFDFHFLVLEDIADTGHRPKIDDWEDYFFLILKSLVYDEEAQFVLPDHVSIICAANMVFSFQESGPDLFRSVRERINDGKGRIRKKGADYLVYALLDTVVDGYFSALEKIGDRIEILEEAILENSNRGAFHRIHALKREMTVIRKSIWPLRDIITRLEMNERLIVDNTRYYLRDVHDHVVQAIDIVETFRDMLANLHEVTLSLNSNKMNEIMKVLTIIATIFIPLTFIAGVYGMNFKYMPELEWRWGYFGVLAFMLMVGSIMGYYFKIKKWL